VHPTAHHYKRRHLYVKTLPIGRHLRLQNRANGVCYTNKISSSGHGLIR
jgi:hypothetical protein